MTSKEELKHILARPYKEQAIHFLNAFWVERNANAEEVYKFFLKFPELDQEKGKEGSDLDEFNAHRLFEFFGEPMTVVHLREQLAAVGIDRKKRLSLIEFLLHKYQITVDTLLSKKVEKGPGSLSEDVIKAQQALNAVQTEIGKIEKKKAELEALANGTGVKAMQAKAELSSLLGQDNTELNRALLSAEAALRKAGSGAAPPGTVWWMGKELEEMKKYKPSKKK
eukprot:TRINITY_DN930_c0_g1_i4.p1 TRINITY_DN930_c0_g1~~TRINITY_DN930_c0_g1_i4.p1  ORF type:complete len:224 (-),score=65.54 TRINITY_DN930_c0_g1_i4:119-790(-)